MLEPIKPELQSAGVKRYVVRLASNCTARRNDLPEYSGRGRRPQYGQLVRPLTRQREGKTLAATRPIDISRRSRGAEELREIFIPQNKVDALLVDIGRNKITIAKSWNPYNKKLLTFDMRSGIL